MKKSKYAATVVIAIMFALTSLGPHQVSAATGWSDDFDDGNYDGWTALNGTWSAGSNYLEAANPTIDNTIYYTSDVKYGNWSFDVFRDGTVEGDIIVFLLGNTVNRSAGFSTGHPHNAIALIIKPDQLVVSLWDMFGIYADISYYETYTHSQSFDGWNHIDLIAMSNYSIMVYLDKDHVISTLSLSITYIDPIEFFFIWAPNNAAFDNIIVTPEETTTTTQTTTSQTTNTTTTQSNTTTATTPSTTPVTSETTTTSATGTTPTTTPTQPPAFDTMTILVIAGGGLVLVVLVIVFMKKR